MNEMKVRRILKAIRCCRDDLCTQCPMQKEICDELRVEMESVPAELLDMIEEELEEKLKWTDDYYRRCKTDKLN